MKISRRFTKQGQDPFASVEYEQRTSRISNPDGSVVFEMTDAQIPRQWSQLATDIMVSKYFRKAGVPQTDANGQPLRDSNGNIVTGPEKSAKEVIHRLAGCWRHWGEKHGYFDTAQDAQAFYDELAYMMLHQMCAPNSPQWFNTGLHFAYGITGPSQGHFYCDPRSGELLKSKDAYSHPQPHACQPYDALVSTPQGPISMGEIVDRKLVGLEVYDGRQSGAGTTRVVAVKSNGEKPVFRIVLKNGAAVEATAEHLVWAVDERRTAGQWLRVDQLTPGKRMHLSTVTTVTKESDEREVLECALAGWLQGDGFVGQYSEGTNRSLTLEFLTINDDEHQFVMSRVARIFEGVHHKVRSVESENAQLDIRRIRLYGEVLRPFVEKYQLLREGADHSIPQVVRRAGLRAQCAYLQAIFQTDGTVRNRRRTSNTSDFVLTTISHPLAAGVQSLLFNLGIYSRIQRGVEKRTNRQTPWFVSIGYAESRHRFRELFDFISSDKLEKARIACSNEFPGKELPSLREESILRIELVGTQPVFDIQTESGQYLSNNIIVHNCFIQSVRDDLVGEGGIMDLWVREARLFKYGSGTGSNFSNLRGENEKLSGGGKSSGLMSFLRIGDRAAGAIKSGGTTRRAAKMCCLDLNHPDVEQFINWKVREELKVAALAEGIKHLSPEQQAQAKKMGLKLDYDFNGEAYYTVSGQNSNNSIRIPNKFFKAVEEDGDWNLIYRTSGKIAKTLKARDLWEQISFAAWRCADPGVQYDDTINQWHTCPKSGRINASNPCVTGDTRVLTPGGIWRRIDTMIHLPARLITNLKGQEIHVTEGAFPTGTRDIFELKTARGYKLTLTADHKVFTRQRGWVEAKDLTTTDEIQLPSKPAAVQEIGEPQDARLFQLVGLFLSSANNSADAICLDKALKGSDLIDIFAQYAHDNWGMGLYNDDYANAAMLEDGDQSNLRNLQSAISSTSLSSRRLLSRLSAFIRTDGNIRRLGDETFTAGLAAQKHLLRGLFTADGIIKNNSLQLNSQSLELLEDVQLILLGFGVKSSIFSLTTGNSQLATLSSTLSGDSPERRNLNSGDAASSHNDGGAVDAAARTADIQRHGLRIDSGSLRLFGKHIGLLPGKKLEQLAQAISFAIQSESRISDLDSGNWDRFATLTPRGREQVFDLTEPVTSSFVANGLTVHNCSEYMFLDDTACNLASLNVLTFFDAETRHFDVEAYKHAIRIWTVVLEVSVLMASFPSEAIARLSYKFRTLGLGYANLGAMLMQAGIAYDSETGRAICAALTSVLTGESYATSAEMAAELGAFPGYEENRDDMLRVIRNHRRAAHNAGAANSQSQISNLKSQIPNNLGNYENLDIPPVPIDHTQFQNQNPLAAKDLLAAATETWDRALTQGERSGYRNAQTTVIAPTGTIGLLMDCDTTGVEPDFALVKFKKLAGGGYFKIANQSLRPALINLGYAPGEINDMMKYVLGSLTLHDAPHINNQTLKAAGLNDEELARIEESLPAMFELAFAFSPWTMGAPALARLGVAESEWQTPGFNLLQRLGFSKSQISQASDIICGRGTIEGAPHIKPEHLPVFDCANKCGKHGQRYIPAEGHIRMMAAAQPFISGAISKTINLPNDATIEDIKNSYHLSWQLGLKANALYRDGSKLSQPLNVKSDDDVEKTTDTEDEEAVEAAREEVADQLADGLAALAASSSDPSILTSDNLSPAPHHTHIIEKIVERIVERPLRRRLPDTRHARTHKFDVAGHEGYITVGLYDDNSPGEVFITMAKEGSTIGGLMDTIATLVSVALQYGVPVESLVRKFEHVRFEPSGMTRNAEIPFAKSLVDYIFRWLAMEFIPGYRAANAPKRPEKKPTLPPSPGSPGEGRGEGSSQHAQPVPLAENAPPIPRPQNKKEGNGHGPRIEPDDTQTFAYGEDTPTPRADPDTSSGINLRTQIIVDPQSQQGSQLQADAPACDVCGSITVRSGTCYKCLNCGNSMGCS